MRNVFIKELTKIAAVNQNIVLVVGDLGFSVIEEFAEQFPDRFFNAGVAEQNMTTISAGLASEGYHVFTYSIANFPTFRCAEQIRNDIAYHNLPVTVVAVGAGLSYGSLGYSHHGVQDYGLLRSMPNMLIASPGDNYEVQACLQYLVENPQPSYFRLGKSNINNIHDKLPKVSPGKWLEVKKGEDAGTTFLTTGATLELAFEALSINKSKYSLHTMPLWGIDFKEEQKKNITRFNKIITVEDHLADGGMGSWLLESSNHINPDLCSRIKIKSLDKIVCGSVGAQSSLNIKGGLSIEELNL